MVFCQNFLICHLSEYNVIVVEGWCVFFNAMIRELFNAGNYFRHLAARSFAVRGGIKTGLISGIRQQTFSRSFEGEQIFTDLY
jgi:hypothetical protein